MEAASVEQHLRPQDVQTRLVELEAILEGHFQLSGGLHSNRYFQCAKVLQYPGLAKELGRLLAEQFNELEIDFVLSPAVGGVLVGHEVARALGRRHIFAERKEGEFRIRRGFEIRKGESGLLVDDVLTRGTAYQELQKLVLGSAASVAGLGVIVDRRDPDVIIPVRVASLLQVQVSTWPPERCPLCAAGRDIESPGSRHASG